MARLGEMTVSVTQITAPKVYFESTDLEDSQYSAYGKTWKAQTLIKGCRDQNLEQFDLPLAGINLGAIPWSRTRTIDDMAYHFKRAMAADLQYPIILDQCGYIADGWHRVLKALLEGQTTIPAYRLREMPEHDGIDSDNKG